MKLKILNHEVKFQWGLGAFEICCDALELSLDEVERGVLLGDQKIMFRLAYSAIQNACEIDEVEVPFNFRKFQAWLDEADEGTATKIMEDYRNSKYLGKTVMDYYEAFSGNKQTGKDSKKKSPSGKS